ncbi:GNAT family N-acetyltransferase [Modicisalibacter coralii]|uniref:GNAT family N-acetyltransferase n=1 Tax=Modicisalibacter coralii TaxID=2304602 RepID=UPI00100AF8CE|nr:GNAT family N-acetyltransferase [Halomonas coralii]
MSGHDHRPRLAMYRSTDAVTLNLGDEIVHLEPATPADRGRAERLVRDNMRPSLKQVGVAWRPRLFREGYAEADNYRLMAGQTIVGFLSLNYTATHAYLRELQLVPAYRRRGIGSWLLREVERLARHRRLDRIRLRVLKNSPALDLYRRHGYRVAIEENATLGMEKTLGTGAPNAR